MKHKKITAILLCLVFLLGIFTLAACKPDPTPDPNNDPVPEGKVRITFNLNYTGASGAPEAQTINNGMTATEPARPTRTGYTFEGWYTAPTGGNLWIFTTPVNETMTLYARWTGGGGTGSDEPAWYQAVNTQLRSAKFSVYSSTGMITAGQTETLVKLVDVEKIGDEYLQTQYMDTGNLISFYRYTPSGWRVWTWGPLEDDTEGWREGSSSDWLAQTKAQGFAQVVSATYGENWGYAKSFTASGTKVIGGKTANKHDGSQDYTGERHGSIYYLWNDILVRTENHMGEQGYGVLMQIEGIQNITEFSRPIPGGSVTPPTPGELPEDFIGSIPQNVSFVLTTNEGSGNDAYVITRTVEKIGNNYFADETWSNNELNGNYYTDDNGIKHEKQFLKKNTDGSFTVWYYNGEQWEEYTAMDKPTTDAEAFNWLGCSNRYGTYYDMARQATNITTEGEYTIRAETTGYWRFWFKDGVMFTVQNRERTTDPFGDYHKITEWNTRIQGFSEEGLPGGTITPPVTQLSAPEVTISSSGVASWAAVNNATGYKYKINDGTEQNAPASRQVTLSNGQSITVKAVGNGTTYSDSGWSVSKTYTQQGGTTQYTVTLAGIGRIEVNGVSQGTSVQVAEGTSVTFIAEPIPQNQVFADWFDGTNVVSNDNPYTFTVTGNVQLTSRFDSQTITNNWPASDKLSLFGASAFTQPSGSTLGGVAEGDLSGQPYLAIIIVNGTAAMFNSVAAALFGQDLSFNYEQVVGTGGISYEIRTLDQLKNTSTNPYTFAAFKPTGEANLYYSVSVEFYTAAVTEGGETTPKNTLSIMFTKAESSSAGGGEPSENLCVVCQQTLTDGVCTNPYCQNNPDYVCENFTDNDNNETGLSGADGKCDICGKPENAHAQASHVHADSDRDGRCDECWYYMITLDNFGPLTMEYNKDGGATGKVIRDGGKIYHVDYYEDGTVCNEYLYVFKDTDSQWHEYSKQEGSWTASGTVYTNEYDVLSNLQYAPLMDYKAAVYKGTDVGQPSNQTTIAGRTCDMYAFTDEYGRQSNYYVDTQTGMVLKYVYFENGPQTQYEVTSYAESGSLGNGYDVP